MSRSAPPSGDEPQLKTIPSGVEGLDIILKGGFLQGGITIIQGRPGTGKTVLGNQLCFNHVAAGGRALYVTLLAESHSRMLMHIGNLSFVRPSVIPDQLSYISGFPLVEAEGLRGLLTLLRQEVRAHRATLLVLDGLIAAERAAASDMEFKKFIHELQTQATMANCAMFLLSSGSEPAEVATAEHTMVDCVLHLRGRLQGWRAERDLEIAKRRGRDFLRGRHAFRISDLGITVFPRFEALLATPTTLERVDGPRLTSGLEQLDKLLGSGLPRSSTTMLLGPSGSGKTTLGLHFLSQCTPEEPGLLFGFYENPASLRAKAASLGLPVTAHFEQGTVEIVWRPPTEALIDETCSQILAAIRTRSVRRLFLDGLGGLAKLAEDPERVGYILTALVNELRALQVTSIFAQESEDLLGSLRTSPVSSPSSKTLSDIADNIILFQFIRLRSRFYRGVAAFKVRDSRIDNQMRLFEIADHGIVIDGSADRAEAIFAEAAAFPAPVGSSSPATRNSRTRRD